MNTTTDDAALREVLDQASEIPPEERDGFLEAACGENSNMRTRIDALLEALDEANQFLVDPTIDAAHDQTTQPEHRGAKPAFHGAEIGKYELLEPIGEGGMGTVYRARQLRPVKREVALKVIKLGMDTSRVITRFNAEKQALAMMDHPSIAKVLDAGATETGRPYFVMELVRGVRITDYCDQNVLKIHERLDLFMQVCNAVQHAHQKGIIHRDLKPSNVLITMQDLSPVPKIIDFGIAKATSQQLTDGEATLFTEMSQLLGTPMYMSPEQVEHGGMYVDTRSDVYSLGGLLYELLTGQTPFNRERLRRASHEELRKIICEEIPPRPSTRMATTADEKDPAVLRGTDPRALSGMLRGDLDWIVMRCLEKNRSRRYDTANALARDIARHLNHEPVEASPPSTSYRMRKFMQRHRVGLTVASGFAVLFVAAAVATALFSLQAMRASKAEAGLEIQKQHAEADKHRADEQSQRAIAEQKRADQVSNVITRLISSAQPTIGSTGRDLRVTDLLKNASEAAERYLAQHPDSEIAVREELAEAFADLDDTENATANLDRAYKLSCAEPGGKTSAKAVRIAAKLAYYLDVEFANQAYEDARQKFGESDASTQRAAWSLSHRLALQTVSGIYRADSLRRALKIARGLVEQVDALPADQITSIHYQFMNQLAVLLNQDQKYSQAQAVVERALQRGDRFGQLRDSTRGALGFSLVEALRGQHELDKAVDWARRTYEFDRATIGAFSERTIRMRKSYIPLLAMTGQSAEGDRVLQENLNLARAFYPGDNDTVLEALTELAQQWLDEDKPDGVGLMAQATRLRGKLNTPEDLQSDPKYYLMARETLLSSLGAKRYSADGSVITQVYCAIEGIWRDHPNLIPASIEVSATTVRYRLSRDTAAGEETFVEGTMATPGQQPSNLPVGLYRLAVEVPQADGAPFRQSFGVLIANWETVTYVDERTQSVGSDIPPLDTTGDQIDRKPVSAIAMIQVLKSPRHSYAPFIHTVGKAAIDLPAGRYRFTTESVDGVRLMVDGRIAINAWSAHRPRRDFRELELDKGNHELKFDSFQKGRRSLLWIRVEGLSDGKWEAPLRSFNRAVEEQTSMNCPEGKAAHGALLAHAGRFKAALGAYGKAIELDPKEERWLEQSALIDLELGDVGGYRKWRGQLLDVPVAEGDIVAAARAALVGMIDPSAKVDPVVQADLGIADPNAAPPSQRALCQFAHGVAAYRAGKFSDCAATLEQAAGGRLTPEAKAAANFFRAMSLQWQGDPEKARALFDSTLKAVEGLPTAYQAELDALEIQDRMICQLSAREAEAMFLK